MLVALGAVADRTKGVGGGDLLPGDGRDDLVELLEHFFRGARQRSRCFGVCEPDSDPFDAGLEALLNRFAPERVVVFGVLRELGDDAADDALEFLALVRVLLDFAGQVLDVEHFFDVMQQSRLHVLARAESAGQDLVAILAVGPLHFFLREASAVPEVVPFEVEAHLGEIGVGEVVLKGMTGRAHQFQSLILVAPTRLEQGLLRFLEQPVLLADNGSAEADVTGAGKHTLGRFALVVLLLLIRASEASALGAVGRDIGGGHPARVQGVALVGVLALLPFVVEVLLGRGRGDAARNVVESEVQFPKYIDELLHLRDDAEILADVDHLGEIGEPVPGVHFVGVGVGKLPLGPLFGDVAVQGLASGVRVSGAVVLRTCGRRGYFRGRALAHGHGCGVGFRLRIGARFPFSRCIPAALLGHVAELVEQDVAAVGLRKIRHLVAHPDVCADSHGAVGRASAVIGVATRVNTRTGQADPQRILGLTTDVVGEIPCAGAELLEDRASPWASGIVGGLGRAGDESLGIGV